MKTHLFVVIILLVGASIALAAWTYTYDVDTPLGTAAPSTIDDYLRLTKDAIQERQNLDHWWPLSGTEVSDAAVGQHRRIMFHSAITSPTVDVNKGVLYMLDVDGGSGLKSELIWEGEDDIALQITELNTAGNGAALNITGTYENEVNFENTGNAFVGDAITVTALGFITLPAGTTDTTEGNLRYDTDGDTLSYRTASAWSTVALAAANEYSCSGTATGDASDMSVDIGFAPGFILAWSAKAGQDLWFWIETDASANYYLDAAAETNREATNLRISVSSTTITFKNGAASYVNQSGEAYHYIAFSLTVGGKNPT